MSTKAYNGLRIKEEDLYKFLTWFREYNQGIAKEKIRHFTEMVSDESVQKKLSEFKETSPDLFSKHADNPRFIEDMARMNIFFSTQSFRDFISSWFECWFEAWPYENTWIINGVFANDSGFCPEDVPEYVEDFQYWNNSDPPSFLSQEEWETRGDVWDAVMSNCNNKITHVVFDPSKLETIWNFKGVFSMNEKERETEIRILSCSVLMSHE